MFLKHLPYYSTMLINAYTYLAFVHAVREVGEKRYYDLVRDVHDIPLMRDLCKVVYIDPSGAVCDAAMWSSDCAAELLWYGEKQGVISHTYIFSWPPCDYMKVTMDDLFDIGVRVARTFFSGHNCLLAVHLDREHAHCHLCVQNLRAADREPAPWMLRGVDGEVLPSEINAGGKHHHTPAFEDALYNDLLRLSRMYGLDDTDFRAKIEANRKLGIEMRTQKLMDAIAQIKKEYPKGLGLEKFSSRLEEYCGANMSIGRDHKLRIGFGTNGKTYPLDKWGLTSEDIWRVLKPQGENSLHQLPQQEQLKFVTMLASEILETDKLCRELYNRYKGITDDKELLEQYWRVYLSAVDLFWRGYKTIGKEQWEEYQEEMDDLYRKIQQIRESSKAAMEAASYITTGMIAASVVAGPAMLLAAMVYFALNVFWGARAQGEENELWEQRELRRDEYLGMRAKHKALAQQATAKDLSLVERYALLLELEKECAPYLSEELMEDMQSYTQPKSRQPRKTSEHER